MPIPAPEAAPIRDADLVIVGLLHLKQVCPLSLQLLMNVMCDLALLAIRCGIAARGPASAAWLMTL